MIKPDIKRVAVVILNWNGEKLLQQFLPSVITHTNTHLARIIVADNGSTDNSVILLKERFPEVDVIAFSENYGFAGGYNKAIELLNEEYVLLLNSDVETTPHWIEPLIEALDAEPSVGVVQPKIKAYKQKKSFEYAGAAGGFIDRLGFPFCRGRILDTVEEDIGQYDTIQTLFWCSGAAFCIRRELYRQTKGLDERFFAHMEEIDLCWRIYNAGYEAKAIPTSVVYHLGGGSLPMNHPHKLFLNYRNNLLMLYKNLPATQRRTILSMRMGVDFASMLFFLMKGESQNARSIIKAYREYYKLKKHYVPSSLKTKHPEIYKGSILWDAYVRKKNRFSQLKR